MRYGATICILLLSALSFGHSFTATGHMEFAREGHTATLLIDGRVLVTGGKNGTGTLASAELFHLASGTFTSTGNMVRARVGHTATLLADGRVLVTGGKNANGTLASAELYHPSTGTFTPTGNMVHARVGHTATLLSNGKVLVAGGGTATAELFDPSTGRFTSAGNMSASRIYHTATLLTTGEVLVAGGTDSGTALGELFNQASATFKPTATGGTTALHLAAALLGNGRVLLTGGDFTGPIGRCIQGGPVSTANAILFNSSNSSFSETGHMNASRASHTSTRLVGGGILIAGGATISSKCVGISVITTVQPLASAELYNPTAGTFALTNNMTTARTAHTATLLGNGTVLVAGGLDINGNALASAELFQ